MDQRTYDVGLEAIKAAPPVSVGAMTLAGLQLSDLVLLVTLLYTVMQLLVLWRDKFGGGNCLRRIGRWLRRRI
ncbi:hypothetical protein [Chitinimonas sp. JJ19]|uniref:hypothetical protein n=1 Tax=Chitinimonas sp. JJ19 TaxID=3109352 RepID=UPI001A3BB530|nr:hypothetical protein [Chitinimonas sp.]